MAKPPPYVLLEPLAPGVYRALHCALRREVAVKRVEDGARFRREVGMALALDHPGCVRVLDVGADYLVMELLRGPTMRQLLVEHGPCPVEIALPTLARLLDALAHAHRRGILHRDLKPENVMYGRPGDAHRPVLIDFGLAQPEDATALTAAGLCFGSPSYVAPERLLGRPHRTASDVYSMGVLAYELLTGARPFRGDGPIAIARAALRGVAVPLRARAPRLSPALAAWVERAMARTPEHRYPDADAMAAALAAVSSRTARAA